MNVRIDGRRSHRSGRRVGRALGVATATLTSSLALTVGLPGSGSVLAAAITVTTTADGIDAAGSCAAVTLASLPGPDGQTSLREAVCAANSNPGADTISLSVNGTFTLTGAANEDNGSTGDLDVKQSLAINGNGTANTIIDGNGNERIFHVLPGSAATFGLANLTLQHGDTRTNSFKQGGALYLHNNVTTTLTAVNVQNNFAGANGAIENRGTLTITGSVISGNQTIPASGGSAGGGVHNTGRLTITGSTISGNSVRGEGGGLSTATGVGVSVTISDTTFSGNSATAAIIIDGNGGAIATDANLGVLTLTNVTMSGNRADNSGGGAFLTALFSTGSVTLNNVTTTGNTADHDKNGVGGGGGLAILTANVTLRNTIVAGNINSISTVRDDISGSLQSASANNLVGVNTGLSGITNGTNSNKVGTSASPIDALLASLADNGGSTQTHAIALASPAINAGSNATCASTDQRGVARAGVCDIGAYELNDTTPPDTTITANPTNPTNSVNASFSFTGTDSGGSGLVGYQCQLDGGGFSACTSPQSYAGLSDGSHTFQVRAVDGAGNVDPTPASYTWLIDTTAPDTTITANPTNPANSAGASFSFTGTDAGSGVASFQCQIDGGGFTPCTSPQAYVGLTDGSHTFQVRAVDTVGNVDPTPASYTWTVDATAPDTTITAQPTNPSNSSDAIFSFTGDDPSGTGVASFECRVDGGGFTPCTSPQAYIGLTDGSHTFEVRAIDGAGNVDPSPASYTWTVDATAPDTTITAQPTNPSASAGASFSFTGDDSGGTGVSSFQCQLDGGGFTPCTSPQAYVGLTDGPHTFEVRAIDTAGNVDPSPASYTWTIDTGAPGTTITAQPTNPSASAGASFSFTGDDSGGTGVSSFECQLDGGGFTPCTSPQAYVGLTDGPHTFEVRAIDGAGSVDPTPATYTWLIDTTAPDTAITAQPTDPSASASAAFSFTGSDPGGSGIASFECQLDGGSFVACTSPEILSGLTDGAHTFRVRAIDAAGNVDPTPAQNGWTVDTTAPDTSITAQPGNPSASAGASFAFTGSDAGGSGVASFECQLDGGGFAACTTPQAYVGLTAGQHTFQVRAIDSVGNVDATPASYTWTIDTAAPDTTLTTTPPNPSSGSGASFAFTGSDTGGSGVASFECRLDGAAFAPCTSPQAYTGLTDGSHSFDVRAVDGAGNVDASPASYTWTVDTSGPDTTITSAPPGSNAGTTAVFSFTGSDGTGSGVVSFECRLDGAAFAPCTSPQTYNGLAAGQHTFQVRAIDAVANVDATPASLTWTVVDVASQAPVTTTATTPVTTVATGGGSLPATGSDPTPWLEYALVLLGCGTMLLTLRGRRRSA